MHCVCQVRVATCCVVEMGNPEGADLLRWCQGQVRSVSVFNLCSPMFIHKRSRGYWTSSLMTVTLFFSISSECWNEQINTFCEVPGVTPKQEIQGQKTKIMKAGRIWEHHCSHSLVTPPSLLSDKTIVGGMPLSSLASPCPALPSPLPTVTFPAGATGVGLKGVCLSSREGSMNYKSR